MKLVVTGALGHIGSQLIRELPRMFPNAEIVMIDNLATQRYCSLFNLPKDGRYRFIETDIMTEDLPAIFNGSTAVVHLAAVTDATSSFENKEAVEQINFIGTERVAQACQQTGCALIFPSTTSVYGTQTDVVDEECPISDLKPQSPYAEAKLKSEQLLQRMGEEKGLNFVICRFGTIFGTSVGMRFHTAINKFCWQAVMGQPLTVWKTALHQHRPYLDLADAVAAIKFIIQQEIFDRQVYNVVTKNAAITDILDAISAHIPDITIEYVTTQIMNQLSYHVSDNRFRGKGFESKGVLEQGICRTIDLLKAARYGSGEAR